MGRRDRPRSVRGRRRSKCPASYLRSRTRLL
jgi:hypothetical protein